MTLGYTTMFALLCCVMGSNRRTAVNFFPPQFFLNFLLSRLVLCTYKNFLQHLFIACSPTIAFYRVYLILWTLGWTRSRPVCSCPGSLPWPWCRRRDSCILGIWPSTGTSSRFCGRATRPLSYTPHSWGLPPQNAHAGTLAGHLASLEKTSW